MRQNRGLDRCERPAEAPFCSRRCRLIDLGQWSDEAYRVEAVDADAWEDLADAQQPRPWLDRHGRARASKVMEPSSSGARLTRVGSQWWSGS